MGQLRRHCIIFFFLFTYLISWGSWGLAGGLPGSLAAGFAALGFFGPSIAGFLCTAIADGIPGIKMLIQRIFAWRVNWRVYFFAVGFPFLLAFLPLVLFSAVGGPTVPYQNLARLPQLFPILLAMLFVGGLNEEPGWRGFALPRLRERYGSLVASLVLGVLWGSWHIPVYIRSGIPLVSLIGFIILVTLIAVVFTALANTTQDSVIIAIVFHAAYNTFIPLLPGLLGVVRLPQHQMITILLVVGSVFATLWYWRRYPELATTRPG
jgi:membrane protease YdiL (CAAX protease family)